MALSGLDAAVAVVPSRNEAQAGTCHRLLWVGAEPLAERPAAGLLAARAANAYYCVPVLSEPPSMNRTTIYPLLAYCIGAVWIAKGLFCKVLGWLEQVCAPSRGRTGIACFHS